MTVTEMSLEFDLLYDNISSNGAPGLNEYEKSVLLTKAQDDLVREYAESFNKLQKGFEASESRRVQLRELIVPYRTTTGYSQVNVGVSPDSKFFSIPTDVYSIIWEEVELTDADACINGLKVGVIPSTHDEYNVMKKSPFRKPNKRKAWRFDVNELPKQDIIGDEVNSLAADSPMVEILAAYDISAYKMRYIKEPEPIILVNFEDDSELTGLGLTVGGFNTQRGTELNSRVHRLIVDRAVELAIRGYRENSLQANVELNNRNV